MEKPLKAVVSIAFKDEGDHTIKRIDILSNRDVDPNGNTLTFGEMQLVNAILADLHGYMGWYSERMKLIRGEDPSEPEKTNKKDVH